MSQRVRRTDADGVCTLVLDRPGKLNALDTTAFEELDAHLAALERDAGTIGCLWGLIGATSTLRALSA